MRLLFLSFVPPSVSVFSKVQAQMNAFDRMVDEGAIESADHLQFQECGSTVSVSWDGVVVGSLRRGSKWAALYNTIIGQPRLYRNVASLARERGIDTVYARKPSVIDFPLAMLLRSLHRAGCRIAFEIPTYPYLSELQGHRALRVLDWTGRWAVRRYATCAVTVTRHERALGAPAVSVSNGVDLDMVPMAAPSVGDMKVLVCVAGFARWHRIERLLDAVSDYYAQGGDVDLIVKMIGGGPARQALESQVFSDPELVKRVEFLGPLHGPELDVQFDGASLGIGNLEESATRGLREVVPLKHREYAARGIPFVYGLTDPDFSQSEYAYELPDGVIDLAEVLRWLDSLDLDGEQIRADVRRLDWVAQLGDVLDSLQGSTALEVPRRRWRRK